VEPVEVAERDHRTAQVVWKWSTMINARHGAPS
jgi:hypothetical protein